MEARCLRGAALQRWRREEKGVAEVVVDVPVEPADVVEDDKEELDAIEGALTSLFSAKAARRAGTVCTAATT